MEFYIWTSMHYCSLSLWVFFDGKFFYKYVYTYRFCVSAYIGWHICPRICLASVCLSKFIFVCAFRTIRLFVRMKAFKFTNTHSRNFGKLSFSLSSSFMCFQLFVEKNKKKKINPIVFNYVGRQKSVSSSHIYIASKVYAPGQCSALNRTK